MAKLPLLKTFCILLLFFQIRIFAFQQSDLISTADSGSDSPATQSEAGNSINEQVSWHKMFTHVPSDYITFFKDSFNSKEIPTYLTIGALTGALMLVDQQGWKSDHMLFKKSLIDHRIADLTVNIGDGKYQFLSAALFAVPGLIFHDETAVKTGSNIAEAIISTGLLVQVLKRIAGRQSPSASTENGGDWDPFPSVKQYQKDQPAFYSFPSGHLSTATAILTVIANNYPDQKWIKPVGYPLLGLLSVSLVSKGMHWYSDLPLAFLLGYSFGNIIAPVRNLPSQNGEKPAFTIFPSISFNGFQLGMKYTF